jgi:hypothetical protein
VPFVTGGDTSDLVVGAALNGGWLLVRWLTGRRGKPADPTTLPLAEADTEMTGNVRPVSGPPASEDTER